MIFNAGGFPYGELPVLFPENGKNSTIKYDSGENGGMDACNDEKLKLSREQTARIDEIYDSVYGMCKVLTENPDLERDMYCIVDIADYAANLLYLLGNRVRYPAVVTGEDGKQHVEEYHCEGGE